MSKPCSNCGVEHDRAGYRYCADCHAAYMRDWRKTHELNEAHKKRAAARSYAKVYKKRGKLVPLPCQKCGCAESEMHHPDHELPLYVIWLCRPCHLTWHAHWRNVAQETFLAWLEKKQPQESERAA